MNTAIYVGLSRQTVLQRAMDIVANNIANAETAGFKVEQPLVETEPLTPPGSSDPIHYVLDKGVGRNFAQGALEETGAPLDVGIEGDGFFTVQTAGGNRYTRDGRFTVDAQNRLVTKAGDPVLGQGGRPIVINPAGPALTIAPDGALTQGPAQVGRLEVVRFADRSVLSKTGDNLFQAPAEAVTAPAADARFRQGMIEASNVQPILEISNMIEITRAYERMAKLMDQSSDLSSRSIERLGRAA